MEKNQIAELFMRGQDCGQVVLEHYADKIGIGHEDACRAAAAFGGGLGIGETCGAVVGAMIVLGYVYGHKGPDDMEQRDIITAKRAEFLEKWNACHPSCSCSKLLGYDIGTPEGLQTILDKGLLFDLCPALVMDSISVLDDMLSI